MTAPRPKLAWSDLTGARVGIWGLGREGHANLRKLASLGVEPVLVDDHPQPDPDGRPVLATSEGGLAALEQCDAVVKTPGLSRYRPEVARLSGLGIPVVGGLGLWLAEADLRRVLCVTGTKGKSTTSSVTGHLLTQLGYRCMVGGNIGASPYDPATDSGSGDFDYWVIEVSSYQATDLPCSPPVVAVTSLHPDHLDWHGGVEQYYRDKLSACSQPGAELTVANADSDQLTERVALLGPRVEWVSADDDPGADWMEPLGLPGRHNRRNALIARRCLVAMGVPGAADDARLRAAAAGYQPLPSRLTSIGTLSGVTFVDDSLSTNALPTLAALDSFPGRRIALIVGGHDRGIDYAPLAAGIVARTAPTYVLTLPDSGPRIRAEIDQAALDQAARNQESDQAPLFAGVTDRSDLESAVAAAYRWAKPDGVVLLSPAAPSFGQFRDYRDRGDAFARAMHAISLAGHRDFPAGHRDQPRRQLGLAKHRPHRRVHAVFAEQRRYAGGVHKHVLVPLVVAPPGSGTVGHERGGLADEPVRGRPGVLGNDGPVLGYPARALLARIDPAEGQVQDVEREHPARPQRARHGHQRPVDGRRIGDVADRVADRDDRVRGGQRILGQGDPSQVRARAKRRSRQRKHFRRRVGRDGLESRRK
jgi:UDP-N-acetylmuramoyl-L-alanine---L-glutamate ligase